MIVNNNTEKKTATTRAYNKILFCRLQHTVCSEASLNHCTLAETKIDSANNQQSK